jgi:hypothetical protein
MSDKNNDRPSEEENAGGGNFDGILKQMAQSASKARVESFKGRVKGILEKKAEGERTVRQAEAELDALRKEFDSGI